MLFEFIKFLFFSMLIVLVSKYLLVALLRKLSIALNLRAKTVGEIAGMATSIPELLTVGVSSFSGLIGASITNILSSNIINLLQYIVSIFWNRNQKLLKNKAIILDLVLVIITIFIPIIFTVKYIELNFKIALIFIILYFLFRICNNYIHKLYLEKEDKKIKENEEEKRILKKENKIEKNNKKIVIYIVGLIGVGILLFIIGNLLGNTLENLCNLFSIPQWVIGILLGVITSIPEFITFFESQKHYNKNNENQLLGVVEATNNLLTSNVLNLFVIQSLGILIYIFL